MSARSEGEPSGPGGLTRRLEALEARAEILNLEGRYARTWDSGDAVGWASLFTEDGTWESVSAGTQAPANVVHGHEALQRFCAECASFITGLHFLHVNELGVEEATAKSLVYFDFKGVASVRGTPDENVHQVVTGYYHVDYVRTPEGWKIRYRLEEPVAFTTSAHIDNRLGRAR